MCVDGKPIVEIRNMSLSFPKLNLEKLQTRWSQRKVSSPQAEAAEVPFNNDRILDFAVGRPSEAFGAPYKIFDHERKIARLPGPPYKFLDRIVEVQGAPFELVAQASCVAEYDFDPSDWYFSSSGGKEMPYAVLLEVALQPCGWLAAYMGSALSSERDLRFRNLGGKAQRSRWTGIGPGTLRTAVTFVGFSKSADMLIQNFKFDVSMAGQSIYSGETMFGFFSEAALSQQVGLKVSENYRGELAPINVPSASEEIAKIAPTAVSVPLPRGPGWPHTRWRLVDEVKIVPVGGIFGLGMCLARKAVQAQDWYFKAHFYQDPVVPGSLGLETLLQTLMVFAAERWKWGPNQGAQAILLQQPHEWKYRGQITPKQEWVQAYCHIKKIDDGEQRIWADGYLEIDGRLIYAFYDFCIEGAENA
jgi:3-hydroxymyristoyl/3-hydroxydecanoyl-(acyl carrier protein) dehydratase